jgi:hypothetical protein
VSAVVAANDPKRTRDGANCVTGRYGILDRRRSRLIRLDVGCSDHLAPLLGFFRNELSEVGGGAKKRR